LRNEIENKILKKREDEKMEDYEELEKKLEKLEVVKNIDNGLL
jgi:hypothetical protein